MSTVKVNVNWNKKDFEVDIDTTQPPTAFKEKMFQLTGVPANKQQILGFKGGALKDNSEWEKVGLKANLKIKMLGTAQDLKKDIPEEEEKKPSEQQDNKSVKIVENYPVGLANLGNTCYMNSTIQALRSVKELNELLKSFNENNNMPQTQLTNAAKELFGNLSSTNEDFVTPYKFLSKFHDAFPHFKQLGEGGVFMQQDAEECYSSILNTFNQCIPKNQDVFCGEFKVTLKCIENEQEEEKVMYESFNKLNCQITKDINFLFQGLALGLQDQVEKTSETLQRNAFYNKKMEVNKLPLNLTIQFNRFLWKNATDPKKEGTKAKILRPVTFPLRFDIHQFCTKELQKSISAVRRIKRLENDKKLGLDDPKETISNNDMDISNDDMYNEKTNVTGLYDLKAVITHKGRTADSGHYVAWVKRGPNDWVLFDDKDVRPASDQEVLSLSGHGGSDYHIAYILLYTTVHAKDLEEKEN